jgi:hypothetical protein
LPLLLGALSGVLIAGCDRGAAADPGVDYRRQWPAAAAGGACQLVDYPTIAQEIGTQFDTAAAGQRDDTYTCALTKAGSDFPDLTLAVTATDADQVIFTATVTPSGSKPVKGLGKIAYQVTLPASGKAGPTLEIGWLSGNQRLMVLDYTFPAKAGTADVSAFAPKFLELAKKIDLTSV